MMVVKWWWIHLPIHIWWMFSNTFYCLVWADTKTDATSDDFDLNLFTVETADPTKPIL
jgi:hypothetical protein